jgi:hypothetical protein
VILLGILCSSGRAVAESAPDPNALDYSAPLDCPNATAFSAQIAARTAMWTRVPSALAVQVRIEPADGRLHGVLTLDDAAGSTVRVVSGERCAEVVQALALIVAILIDPEADTRALPIVPEATVAPPNAETGVHRPLESGEASEARWSASAGTELTVTAGVGERALVGERWFAGIARERADRPSFTLRFAFGRDRSGTINHGPGASSALSRTLLRVDACGLLVTTPALAFTLCGFGEGGQIDAVGLHPLRSESPTVGWLALGSLVRAGYRYERVLGLEAELGVGLPLSRYRFRFGDESLYETSVLVVGGGIGLSLHFP